MKKGKIFPADCYYLAIAIYVLAHNIQISYAYNQWTASGSMMLNVVQFLRYVSYALCFVKILFLSKVKRAYIWVGIIILCGSVLAIMTGTANSPIFYFLFFMAGVNTDFKKIVKIFLRIQISSFVLYVFCGTTGIVGDETIEQTGRIRAFLGYGWVNRASYCMLFMTLEMLYLWEYKLKIIPALILLILNAFPYFMTYTRFPFLVAIAVFIVGLIYNYIYVGRKTKYHTLLRGKKLYIYFAITIIISAVLPLIYNEKNYVWYTLNEIVTGRLELGKNAIQRYGLHIWGNKIEWVGSSTLLFGLSKSKEYFYVDAGFLNLALEYGLLFVAAIICLYYGGIYTAQKNKDDAIILSFFVLFSLFVFEPYVIDFAFNPFPLFFVSTLGYHRKSYFKTLRNHLR